MKKDPISESLGMTPYTPEEPFSHTLQVLDHDAVDHSEQFEEVKTNLRQMLSKAGPAFNNLIDISSTAQSDKMFLALAALMKTMVEANRELADTTTKQIAAAGGPSDKNPTTVNNNLNITATDLLDMIKGSQQK